mgnify:CR=1 FL=1
MASEQGDRIVCRLRFRYEGRDRVFTLADRPLVIGRARVAHAVGHRSDADQAAADIEGALEHAVANKVGRGAVAQRGERHAEPSGVSRASNPAAVFITSRSM